MYSFLLDRVQGDIRRRGPFMESLFQYADYRDFIRDYMEHKKAQNSAFSYRYLAQKAGINSSSFYTQVVKGRRNLTKQTIIKTIHALKLTHEESLYFEYLVFFSQAKTSTEKNHFFELMVELRKNNDINAVSDEEFDYFAEWYHCVIREVVTMVEDPTDYEMMAKKLKPKVTPLQVKQSVALLERLGFITEVDGTYEQREPLLHSSSNSDFRRYHLIQFQLKMIDVLRSSYGNWDDNERLTATTVYAISNRNYKRSIEILRETRKKLLALAETDEEASAVYMLSTNLIPVTRQIFRRGKS